MALFFFLSLFRLRMFSWVACEAKVDGANVSAAGDGQSSCFFFPWVARSAEGEGVGIWGR